MLIRPKVDMFEALRLTREGRLHEAMAVLRGASLTTSYPPPQGAPAQPRLEGMGERKNEHGKGIQTKGPLVDLVPPPDPSGTWKAIPAKENEPTAAEADFHPRKTFRGLFHHLRGVSLREQALPPSVDVPSFQYHTFRNEAGSRRYKLYIPTRYTGQPLPLVVMLHGCTQSPDDFAAGTRMNKCAEEQTFFVAYPEQPKSANPNKCWNWFNANDQARESGEPLLIAGLTRQIMLNYSVDQDRVYIAGMSAGGAAAAIMGSTYPDLFAAIGVHSGLACGAARDIPSAFTAMREGAPVVRRSHLNETFVPTIVFHGDDDRTVSRVNGDQVVAQANAGTNHRTTVLHGKSAAGTKFTRTVQADISGRSVVEQWILHGSGHAWSGGSLDGSFTDPCGPDASREFLRFFFQHRRKHDCPCS